MSRAALRRAKGIITVTKSLKDFFVLRKVPEKKLYVAHDGVDIDAFQVLKTKEEARKLFGLPLDKKIILYTGHLYPWKGQTHSPGRHICCLRMQFLFLSVGPMGTFLSSEINIEVMRNVWFSARSPTQTSRYI